MILFEGEIMETCNILIADSESNSRICFAKIMDAVVPGAFVHQADSVGEALAVLERSKVDIVFLDISLPPTGGMGIMEKLSRMITQPLVFVTSTHEHIGRAQEVVKSGASGYFVKPSKSMTFSRLFYNVVMGEKEPEGSDTLMLSTAIGICPTLVSSIIAVEKVQRNVLNVYTHERVLKDVRGTLLEMEGYLSPDFVYISRQCMLNKSAIVRIIPKTREVFLNVKDSEEGFVCSRERARDLVLWFNSKKKNGN